MVSITIDNLDEETADLLRVRAAANDCSLEEEARNILCYIFQRPGLLPPPKNLGIAIYELFRPFGDVELELPTREPFREPLKFD
jgi:plasmid stability protein